MSSSGQELLSIYGFLNAASDKDSEKLFYRSLNLPKHGPAHVFDVETVTMIKSALPEELGEGLDDCKDMMKKSLISTTSIGARTLDALTINRQKVEMTNPMARRGFSGKMFGGGQGGNEQQT